MAWSPPTPCLAESHCACVLANGCKFAVTFWAPDDDDEKKWKIIKWGYSLKISGEGFVLHDLGPAGQEQRGGKK